MSKCYCTLVVFCRHKP